jgi:hypothetical protein
MSKTNPLVLWIILWILGMFLITIKNRIIAGSGIVFGEIITANLIMDIVIIPISIVGYFLIKLVAKIVGAKDFLNGNTALRNSFIMWLVFYTFVFLFPLFKK